MSSTRHRTGTGRAAGVIIMMVTLAMTMALPAFGQGLANENRMQDYDRLPEPDDLYMLTVDPALLDQVALLDAEEFDVRLAATERLAEMVDDRWHLYALLLRENLTPEQRQRLLEVARRKLINTPRGAVGISMNWKQLTATTGAVEISDLIPGLPAERVLQLRDRIVALDGRPLADRNDLVRHVQRRLPGESVAITVQRPKRDETGEMVLGEDGQPLYDVIDVELALGSAELLRGPDGRAVPDSVVQRERHRESEGAVVRYGAAPRTMEIRPGSEGTFARHARPQSDESIDQHPMIQMLIRQKESYARAGREIDPVVRADWEAQLQRLVNKMTSPGLQKAERAQLRGLVRRYQHHMTDGVFRRRADRVPRDVGAPEIVPK